MAGPHEKLKRNQRRHRKARQAKNRFGLAFDPDRHGHKCDRFAGTHIDPPEMDGADLFQNHLYQIELADRDTTARYQRIIGLQRLMDERA